MQSNYVNEPTIYFGGERLKCALFHKHLGTYIGVNVNQLNMCDHIRKFNAEVNIIMSQFKHVYSTTKYRLFKTYCMPLYGCQLWDFSGSEVGKFFTAWRKAVRYIWNLPYTSHSALLHLICTDLDIECQLHKRFLKFFYKMYHSDNYVTTFLARLALGGSRSSVCNSLNFILSKYRLLKSNFQCYDFYELLQSVKSAPDPAGNRTASLVRELCMIRDGELHSNFSRAECDMCIAHLCTA